MTKEKHQEIIDKYTAWRKNTPDTWIDHTVEQEDILSAINIAAKSKNKDDEKNKHQWRLKNENLDNFAEKLSTKSKEITEAADFANLLDIIEACKVKGIGELASYDTANRIGCKIKVYPDKIYLHAGTKEGVEKLLGKRISKRFIEKSDLPEPFKSSELSCADLEALFCIYKSEL